MKKIYNAPESTVIRVNLVHVVADSMGKYDTTLTGSNAGWSREDNNWDIWGGNADEE